MSEQLVILYHPRCKASQSLLSKLPDKIENIKLIDITAMQQIPQGVRSVPCGILDSKQITGKALFDKVASICDGPVGLNIYGASNQAGFLDKSSNFSLTNNFSLVDGATGSNGMEGVPKYDESQRKTLEELKLERD